MRRITKWLFATQAFCRYSNFTSRWKVKASENCCEFQTGGKRVAASHCAQSIQRKWQPRIMEERSCESRGQQSSPRKTMRKGQLDETVRIEQASFGAWYFSLFWPKVQRGKNEKIAKKGNHRFSIEGDISQTIFFDGVRFFDGGIAISQKIFVTV